MLQAQSSQLITFAPQLQLPPVFRCKMCLEEADLVSKVLSVLHHHSLCGGLIWHAESLLASLPSSLPDPL